MPTPPTPWCEKGVTAGRHPSAPSTHKVSRARRHRNLVSLVTLVASMPTWITPTVTGTAQRQTRFRRAVVDVISESMVALLHHLATREDHVWVALPHILTVRALLRRELIRRADGDGRKTDLVLTASGRALHRARCVRCRDMLGRRASDPYFNGNND